MSHLAAMPKIVLASMDLLPFGNKWTANRKSLPRTGTYSSDTLGKLFDNKVGNAWYRFGRSQSLTQFDGSPKVIWQVLTLEPRYVYDDRDVLFTGGGNGPYYALRSLPESSLSPYYLISVLSHPLLEMMIRSSGSAFQGDYISHGKQFLETLPIRIVLPGDKQGKGIYDEIVQRTIQLVDATKQYVAATIPQDRVLFQRQRDLLRGVIEEAISALYGLTSEDCALLSPASEDNE
jgi:hypothetical protein